MLKKNKFAAVIHIGAHAVRLYIAQVIRKNNVKIIEELWMPIQIGKEAFSKGRISDATITELINCITNFKKNLESYQIYNVRVVSTAALRVALNTDIVIDRISRTTGFNVEVIGNVEEVNILYQAFKQKTKSLISYKDKNIFLFLLSSGSSQYIFLNKDNIIVSETFNIGTMGMQKMYELHSNSVMLFLHDVANTVFDSFNNYEKIPNIDMFIVINEDIIELLVNSKNLKSDKNMLLYRISNKNLDKLYNEALKIPFKKFKSKYNLQDNNYETAIISFLLSTLLFNMTDSKRIYFSPLNFSTSVLLEMSQLNKTITESFTEEKVDNIISASIALAKKYNEDISYVNRGRKIAVKLFDELKEKLGLLEENKIYLEVAMILLNVGKFIDFKGHHKHSATIIACSEILGLSKQEMILISQLARYHRRALPKDSHSSYIKLEENERLLISRLASIIRISDGINKIKSIEVTDIKVSISENDCILYITLKDDHYEHFDLLCMNIKEKSYFFENFFGYNIKVEKG